MLTIQEFGARIGRFMLGHLPPTQFMWAFFMGILGVFILLSVILVYHWKTYSFDGSTIQRVAALYFGISLFCLIAMAVALFTYHP